MTSLIGDVKISLSYTAPKWRVQVDRVSTGEMISMATASYEREAQELYDTAVKQWTAAHADAENELHEYTEAPVWH